MSLKTSKNLTRLEWGLVALIIALIAVFSFFIFGNVRDIKHEPGFGPKNSILDFFHSDDHKMKTPEISKIKDWTTFEFINTIFKIPSEYLQNELHIEHKKYPKISIKQYAKSINSDPKKVVEAVKDAVKKYQDSHPESLSGSISSEENKDKPAWLKNEWDQEKVLPPDIDASKNEWIELEVPPSESNISGAK